MENPKSGKEKDKSICCNKESVYPRACGYCHTHYVGWIEGYKTKAWKKGTDCDHQIENIPVELRDARVSKYKQKHPNRTVVKGDIIIFAKSSYHDKLYRNHMMMICDGLTTIPLDFDYIDYGTLPKLFDPFKDDVPLTYWSLDLPRKEKGLNRSVSTYHGGTNNHNGVIWFDIKPFMTECLENINHEVDPDDDTLLWVYSFFECRQKQYYIVFGYTEISKIDRVNKKILGYVNSFGESLVPAEMNMINDLVNLSFRKHIPDDRILCVQVLDF